MCLASRSVLKNGVKDFFFKKKAKPKKGIVFQKTSETWSLGHSLPSSWNDNLDPVGLEPLSVFLTSGAPLRRRRRLLHTF